MSRIFISYWRDDSGGWAGRLYDRLSRRFGRENAFMNIDTIDPGLDFVKVIQEAVGSCDALIAIIGRQWLTSVDAVYLSRRFQEAIGGTLVLMAAAQHDCAIVQTCSEIVAKRSYGCET